MDSVTPENEQVEEQPLPAPVSRPTTLFSPAIILGFLTLTVVVAGTYYLGTRQKISTSLTQSSTLTPTNTANQTLTVTSEIDGWKTYTNTAYKYSIKYPPDWEIGVKGGADAATFYAPYLDSPCNYEAGDRCGQIQITTEDYDYSRKLDDYFKLTTTQPWPDKEISRTTTRLGGENAIEMEWFLNNYFYGSGKDEHGLVLRTIKAIHNGKVFSISITEAGKDRAAIRTVNDWQNNRLYNKIISTFKFLDSIDSTPDIKVSSPP